MGTLPIPAGTLDALRTQFPNDYALRTVELKVRVKDWSGARTGVGTKTITDTVIAGPGGNRYKVREVTSKDVISSGGKYQAGQYKVGPITPPYPGGPFTAADLIPAKSSSPREVYYGVTDATGITQWCSMVGADTMNALHWFVFLAPTGAQDP